MRVLCRVGCAHEQACIGRSIRLAARGIHQGTHASYSACQVRKAVVELLVALYIDTGANVNLLDSDASKLLVV